jgi:c-di-GMP-related signal transduction protein
MNIYGYELLFRAGLESFFRSDNPDLATSSVVVDSFLLFGMKALTGGRPAFVNFTRNLLINDYARVLPPEQAVIEILESVEPDGEVIEACRSLTARGYTLALDDFVLNDTFSPLVDLVSIIKVDFHRTTEESRQKLLKVYGRRGIRFLAEKVETRAEFDEAIGAGYSLFQGFFFGKPETLSSREIPACKHNYWQILQAVHQPNPDFAELENIIRHESALSYKLLRYLNSAAFALRMEIRSIRHALALLGVNEVRKWISVVALAGAAEDRPSELIVTSMVRARFAELLAAETGLHERAPELFLLGLLSMMDSILQRPIADILEEVPVAADVKAALLGKPCRLRAVHELILAYENGDWDEIGRRSEALAVDESAVAEAYLSAVEWASQTYQISAAA